MSVQYEDDLPIHSQILYWLTPAVHHILRLSARSVVAIFNSAHLILLLEFATYNLLIYDY